MPFQETMEALTLLKEQGKVLHVGVSNFSVEQMEEAGKYCPIEAYQPQYSMVCRSNEAQIKWAAEQGMGVMAYGSLGAGILTGAYRTLTNFPASDNRSRFYKHFQEPMFSKVMKLLGVMDGRCPCPRSLSTGRPRSPSFLPASWARRPAKRSRKTAPALTGP